MPVTPLDWFTRASDALIKFDAHFNLLREDELDEYELEFQSAKMDKLWIEVEETFGFG